MIWIPGKVVPEPRIHRDSLLREKMMEIFPLSVRRPGEVGESGGSLASRTFYQNEIYSFRETRWREGDPKNWLSLRKSYWMKCRMNASFSFMLRIYKGVIFFSLQNCSFYCLTVSQIAIWLRILVIYIYLKKLKTSCDAEGIQTRFIGTLG